jgi:L-threonylcarbamoyladenylate synthase
MPAHPVARALIASTGRPLAAPSANRFTRLSPTLARHVERSLGARVDLILDGGPTSVGIESTVVDLTSARPTLLRPGTLAADAIEAVLGTTLARPAAPAAPDAPRLAPGMVERHYAPRAAVWLFDEGERDEISARLATARRDAAGSTAGGPRVGALLLAAWDEAPAPDVVVTMPGDPAAYARRVYAALHALDDEGCAVVLVERPPAEPEWAGVRDRLERSAR